MKELIQTYFYHELHETNTSLDYILFYCLKKTATLTIENKTYIMNPLDLVMINPKENYEMNVDDGTLVKLVLSSKELARLSLNQYRIECNSIHEKREAYDPLRNKIHRLLSTYSMTSYSKLWYQQYSLDIIVYLMNEFSNTVLIEDHYRKLQIENYLYTHYQEDLTLQKIADDFGLTPPYFSKYFKEVFHMTFLKYLNQLRVEASLNDLLNTNHTILRIALDYGFPNLNAYTNAFKHHYHQNPSSYRQTYKHKEMTSTLSYEQVKEDFIPYQDINQDLREIVVDVHQDKTKLDPYWFKLCNMGSLKTLLHHQKKDQYILLQDQFHFEYARVVLDTYQSHPTFVEEQQALDFIMNQQFKLIFIIDYLDYHHQVGFLNYLEAFIHHFMNRYGYAHVIEWKFELVCDSPFMDTEAKEYYVFYTKINHLLKKLGILSSLTGPGLLLMDDGSNLIRFLDANPSIDTLTLSIAPYSYHYKHHQRFDHTLTNTSYVLSMYEQAKKICEKYDHIKDIYISSWKMSYKEVDELNDSCFIAANMIQNYLKGYDKLKSLPIERPLDLMHEQEIEDNVLSGLSGIISRNHVKKPSFYAYQFLKLEPYLVFKEKDVIVTCDDHESMELVCHNCQSLSIFHSNEVCFIDERKKVFRIELKGLRKGYYFLKRKRMNELEGSAQSILKKMNYKDRSLFSGEENDYLIALAQPALSSDCFEVKKDSLILEIELEPNEITHLRLSYLY